MAITGTGTQADPYIVHSYDELKTACNNNNVFVELANDIDCNSYGEDFEWEGVWLGTNSDFDLKGHTIKNFKVREGDYYAFKLQNYSKMHNGKILNMYLARSSGFNKLSGNTETRFAYIENLSISINTGVGVDRNRIFESLDINACAIYIEGAIGLSSRGDNCYFNPYSQDYPIRNCDIYVNHPNTDKSGHIFRAGGGNTKYIKNCRIRGVFNNNASDPAGYRCFSSNCGMQNCVWDVSSDNILSVCDSGTSNTGIINTDNLPVLSERNGLTAVTSQEIINGDALRAKGFDVVNVSA